MRFAFQRRCKCGVVTQAADRNEMMPLAMSNTPGSAEAGKRKCADDYRRFCSQWDLGTRGPEQLHAPAWRSANPRLRQGLIQAGAVSQTEVERRRRAAGR